MAGKNKKLQEISNLRYKGKIKDAFEKLTEFEKEQHDPESSIRAQLIKAILTAGWESWEKSLEIINSIIPKSEKLGNTLVLIDTLFSKANCLLYAQQYKKSLEQTEGTIEILDKNLESSEYEYQVRLAWLLNIKSRCLSWMGKDSHAIDIAKQGLAIAQSLNDEELLFNYYALLGLCEFQADSFDESIAYDEAGYKLAIETKNDSKALSFALALAQRYRGSGNFELAMEYVDITLKYADKLKVPVPWVVFFKGILYWNTGEIEKCIPIFKEIIPKVVHETTHKEKGLVLMGKAIIEQVEGDITKSVEYLSEAVNLAKNNNDYFSANIFSICLIRVLFDKGEFDKVLEICFSMLDEFKDGKKPVSIYSIYFEMGKTYHVKGEYNLALEYVQKALELYRKFDRDLYIAQSLFILIQITIDKNDKELYTKYLEELEDFVKLHPTDLFELMHLTSQALVLKASSRPRDWTKAIDILLKVVDEKFTKHGFVIVALINLCELLMNEYSISGDDQVLEELETYMDELTEIARMQNIYHLRLEANNLQILTHWLKAQNSKVEIDLQKAKTLLDNTRKVADEEGMLRLAEKMSLQQEQLLKQLSQWDDFIRKYYEFIKE